MAADLSRFYGRMGYVLVQLLCMDSSRLTPFPRDFQAGSHEHPDH